MEGREERGMEGLRGGKREGWNGQREGGTEGESDGLRRTKSRKGGREV